MFAFNPLGLLPWWQHSVEQVSHMLANVQSVPAAIENMLLAAHDLGMACRGSSMYSRPTMNCACGWEKRVKW